MDLAVDLNHMLRLAVALVLSGFLGWERELADRPAGLRTHMTVGMASALFVILAEVLNTRYAGMDIARIDPTRVLQAVVAGIAFLGAGTIFVMRSGSGRPRGLTTAASLLATSGVGIAAGIEAYGLAIGATFMLLVVLSVLGRLPVGKDDPAKKSNDAPSP